MSSLCAVHVATYNFGVNPYCITICCIVQYIDTYFHLHCNSEYCNMSGSLLCIKLYCIIRHLLIYAVDITRKPREGEIDR